MSGLILAFNRDNPREWLSGNIQSPHPVTVTLRGEDGEVGVSLALLAADSGLVSSMLLTHDGREKQITSSQLSVEIRRTGFQRKMKLLRNSEVFLLMLQSQVKLTVHTSDLVIGDQDAVHSHSDPESETWTWRKDTTFNFDSDSETKNTNHLLLSQERTFS